MEPIKVGLLGFGTVGSGTFTVLRRNQEEIKRRAGRGIEIARIAVRNPAKASAALGGAAGTVALTDDFNAVVDDPSIAIVAEMIGGTGVARDLVLRAINNGKHVVTANKALLAVHGTEIFEAARANGVMVAFEAAVAGGIPIIKALREGLTANRIQYIAGIINGTTNYILSEMRDRGLDFATALKAAQELGYAEADPTFDIEGVDAAHKATIMSAIAFGTEVAQRAVYVEGISSITPQDLRAAEELGYRIKLLGVAVRTKTGIEQRVHPTMVPRTSSVAQVMGVTNAVTIDGAGISPITLVGPGAGGAATASAVVADIADVARGVRALPFGRPVARLKPTKKAPMQRHEGGYYIRLMARDLAGTAATIATRLAERGISIESIVQRHPDRSGDHKISAKASSPVPVILITYATSEDAMRGALQAVQRDKVISGRPQVIRIEKN
jgi:homoserine dehydrogenase